VVADLVGELGVDVNDVVVVAARHQVRAEQDVVEDLGVALVDVGVALRFGQGWRAGRSNRDPARSAVVARTRCR
jgi:hypothetical protein